MENPTPHENDDSRSVSEKNSSGQSLAKQASQSSSTQQNNQMPDSTPTAVRTEQSSWTPAMPPPPRPNFKATPNSAQPSSHSSQDSSQILPAASAEQKHASGRQRTTSSKDPSQEATQRVTRKRSHEETDQRQAAEKAEDEGGHDHDEDVFDEFEEPANAISPFDWEELQQRYHDHMQCCEDQEQDLYHRFGELCNYFSVWSESGSSHETERSFKRMRTQVTLVQHKEKELEAKRMHYIKVVEAFQMITRIINDDEQADPTTPAAARRRSVTGRQVSHAAIIDAYD